MKLIQLEEKTNTFYNLYLGHYNKNLANTPYNTLCVNKINLYNEYHGSLLTLLMNFQFIELNNNIKDLNPLFGCVLLNDIDDYNNFIKSYFKIKDGKLIFNTTFFHNLHTVPYPNNIEEVCHCIQKTIDLLDSMIDDLKQFYKTNKLKPYKFTKKL